MVLFLSLFQSDSVVGRLQPSSSERVNCVGACAGIVPTTLPRRTDPRVEQDDVCDSDRETCLVGS
jgi:hypothetical protein